MIEIIHEFVIKEGARGRFELVFGPGGAWSGIFAQCSGFRGTILLRDAKDSRRYLVIDFWETEAQWEQALAEHGAEYASLGATFDGWSESKTEVGVFRVLAEATVHPGGRAKRGKVATSLGGRQKLR